MQTLNMHVPTTYTKDAPIIQPIHSTSKIARAP
jgi:hypothetical protein